MATRRCSSGSTEIGLDELEEVIVEAWLARAPKRLAQDYIESRFPSGE